MTVPTHVALTIKGETRQIEVTDLWKTGERLLSTTPVGLFQKRAGTKAWPARVNFWLRKDGTYTTDGTATILNRSGYRLVAFNDATEAPKNRSAHNSATC